MIFDFNSALYDIDTLHSVIYAIKRKTVWPIMCESSDVKCSQIRIDEAKITRITW